MKQNIISFSVNDTRTPLLKSTCDNNGKQINSMQSFISRLTLGFQSLGLKRRERVLPLLILPFRLLPSPINCTLPPTPLQKVAPLYLHPMAPRMNTQRQRHPYVSRNGLHSTMLQNIHANITRYLKGTHEVYAYVIGLICLQYDTHQKITSTQTNKTASHICICINSIPLSSIMIEEHFLYFIAFFTSSNTH